MKTCSAAFAVFVSVVLCVVQGMAFAQAKEGVSFEFSSGGAYHIQGYGEWVVRLDADGAFSVSHNGGGKIENCGTFTLANNENVEMWKLIRGAEIGKLESSKRPGVPDEAQYTFALKDGAQTHSVKIWLNDARENDTLSALVDRVGVLIEVYTKKKPVLK